MKLFRQRTLWFPTWQGALLLLAAFAIASLFFLLTIHDFLAVTRREVKADVLAVEAWVPGVVHRAAVEEFNEGRYRHLAITDVGDFITECGQDNGYRLADARRFMMYMDIPAERILLCSSTESKNKRTFSMAIAVRRELEARHIRPAGINVISPAGHARKSWLAYRRAMGEEFPVGVIAVQTGDYDPSRWWASSQGAKWVVANGIGWLYEYFLGG